MSTSRTPPARSTPQFHPHHQVVARCVLLTTRLLHQDLTPLDPIPGLGWSSQVSDGLRLTMSNPVKSSVKQQGSGPITASCGVALSGHRFQQLLASLAGHVASRCWFAAAGKAMVASVGSRVSDSGGAAG